MALVFGAATSDRVNCGSGASLDDLNTVTVTMWCYLTTLSINRCFVTKGIGTSNTRRGLFCRLDGTGGNVALIANRATSNTSYVTTDTPFATVNRWHFWSWTFNTAAAAGEIFVPYLGTLTTPAAVRAVSATDGSGAFQSDAATDLIIGNSSATNVAFQGTIAWVGIWNRVMTLYEIREQQFNPRITPGCVGFWRLGGRYGTAIQRDESGFANNGTVTGATANTLEPPLYIPPPRQRIWYVPEVAAAATAVPVFYRHLQTQGIS